MSLRDIIYLDSGRLTSLLSQLLGGVSETGREAETDAAANTKTLATDEKQLGSAVSQQVERVREVRYFDHLLTVFMDTVGENIVDLSAKELRAAPRRRFLGARSCARQGRSS